MKTRRTVFLAVTHGRHATLLLRSGFLDTLKARSEELRVLILSPNANEEYFAEEFGANFELEVIEPQSSRLFARLGWLRRYLLLGSRASRSMEIIMEAAKRRSRWQYWLTRLINGLTGAFPVTIPLVRQLDRWLFPDREFRWIFEKYQPDLLVIASVLHNQCFFLLRRARRAGVPTLFVVESWDNPTCKVGFLERPEHFTVWNEIMRRELMEFHHVEPDHIHVTGAPYHDMYAYPERFFSRSELASRYDMDPGCKWIVIAATLQELYPDFDRFLEKLEAARLEGRFGEEVQFLIRPHPQAIAGYSEGHGVAELRVIKERFPSVFFDVPAVLSRRLPVDVDPLDPLKMAEILLHADVVISFFSTITIDTCAVDTPVVLPAFSDYADRTWFPTMAQRLEFNHHSNVIAAGGVTVASDFDDLVAAVMCYLDDPSLHREGRRRVTHEQCGELDGEAGRRMAEVVLNMLELPLPDRGRDACSAPGQATPR